MEIYLKDYPRPARRHEQAHQLWPVLTGWAQFHIKGRLEQPGIITYGEAAKLIGYDPRTGVTLGKALWLISNFCDRMGVPHLNAIVVVFETGEPGEGIPLGSGHTLESMREEVLKFNWFNYRAPTLRNFRELAAELRLTPSHS